MSGEAKESKVEIAKRASHYLRGTIVETLASDAPSFEHDDMQLLKFHGTYQQDDRDARAAAKATGGGKEYSFMVRMRIPGGIVTPEQFLCADRLSERYSAYRSLRITTRQGFQLHGVLKDDLKATIAGINESLLSTIAACGDVGRNVMASPLPLSNPAHEAVRDLARRVAERMCPKTRAYHEIWLDGEKVADSEPVEPIYGETYLPRKFKVGIALPEDNSVDVYTQDVGLIAIVKDGQLAGVNVLVGGGLGMTHRKPETFARLGTEFGYIEADHVVEAVRVIAEIFRDTGDRSDRKHARLKYVVQEQGIEKIRDMFRERADFELGDWIDVPQLQFDDGLGARPQGDGKFFFGLFVENGRIMDTDAARTKTALRKVVEALRPGIVLTPNQSILFTDLAEADVKKVETILGAYGVPHLDGLTGVRRYSMACPALPTCGLALAESERVMPPLVDELEAELGAFGLEDEPITVRMTGCPNSCARPYTADIAFVGRKMGVYDILVGGRLSGDRLTDLYAENVKREDLIATLHPLIEAWARDRQADEPLGDFYQRVYGTGQRRTVLTGAKDNPTRDRL